MQRYRFTLWTGVWKSTSYIVEASSEGEAHEVYEAGEAKFEEAEFHDVECGAYSDLEIEEI